MSQSTLIRTHRCINITYPFVFYEKICISACYVEIVIGYQGGEYSNSVLNKEQMY